MLLLFGQLPKLKIYSKQFYFLLIRHSFISLLKSKKEKLISSPFFLSLFGVKKGSQNNHWKRERGEREPKNARSGEKKKEREKKSRSTNLPCSQQTKWTRPLAVAFD